MLHLLAVICLTTVLELLNVVQDLLQFGFAPSRSRSMCIVITIIPLAFDIVAESVTGLHNRLYLAAKTCRKVEGYGTWAVINEIENP